MNNHTKKNNWKTKNKHMIKEQKSNWKIKVRPNHPSISSSSFLNRKKFNNHKYKNTIIKRDKRKSWRENGETIDGKPEACMFISLFPSNNAISLLSLFFNVYCGYTIYVEKAKRIILMWRANPKGYDYKMKPNT